jgi:hypothetical protein
MGCKAIEDIDREKHRAAMLLSWTFGAHLGAEGGMFQSRDGGRDSNSTGGVTAETVQSMIDAEVGPTAPDPTLIFDQYLI